MIQLLLNHNADITVKNAGGKTAFDYMKENEEFKKTELFKKLSAQFPQ
ncbi:MAG: ankyrin repeat domain-containing protein [Oligoflexia bacterium]|nr:ankyrin repeat domain-containing protein [Oligoflexia bacterium]